MNPQNFRKSHFRNIFEDNSLKIGLLIITLLSVFINHCYSQTFEVGPYGGVSYYLGDLNPGMHYKDSKIAYGALIRYNLNSRWAVKLSGYRGQVSGSSQSNPYLPGKDLSFISPITDISGVAEFNFFEYFTSSKREAFTPYIYAGIGVFFFNPESNGVQLKSAGTEGQNIGYNGRKPYATTAVNLPFGIGVKFSLAKKICVGAFWEMHKTFTDYIDDVSTTYYLKGQDINPNDVTALLSDPGRNHQPDQMRGNPATKDWYSFSGVFLTYKFNIRSSKKCRDIHHK